MVVYSIYSESGEYEGFFTNPEEAQEWELQGATIVMELRSL